MERLLLVDGGGSKTEILLLKENYEPEKYFLYGGINPFHIGLENLTHRFQKIRNSISVRLSHLVISLAGSSTLRREIERILREVFPESRVSLLTDIEASFYAATMGADGIIVSSGTGSFAYGKVENRDWRAGGWGYLFDDEGSSYWIGREAMSHFFRVMDGREEPSMLSTMLRHHLKLANLIQEFPNLYERLRNPIELAALSKIVSKAAEEGDTKARAILRDAALHLFNLVYAVSTHIKKDEKSILEVYGIGGMLLRCEPLRAELSRLIHQNLPNHIFTTSRNPPLMGCVVYLLQKKENRVEEKIVESILDFIRGVSYEES